eukprot:1317509-Amorphochlora_amoeboformis.AAC.1
MSPTRPDVRMGGVIGGVCEGFREVPRLRRGAFHRTHHATITPRREYRCQISSYRMFDIKMGFRDNLGQYRIVPGLAGGLGCDEAW